MKRSSETSYHFIATDLAEFSSRISLDRQERRRQIVVKTIFFILALSLIEGPLRKWFLPQFATPLVILRDPFVIILYIYAAQSGFLLRHGVATVWLGFAALTSVFGLIQFIVHGYGVVEWMLAVRTYWLYVPLAFVIAKTFKTPDIKVFSRSMLLISMPYAFLMVLQYSSPPSAFINLGIGLDESAAVGVADGLLRPFGLFTYTGPNVQFTTLMLAVLMSTYVSGRSFRRSLLVFSSSGIAVAIMSVLTGSRTIIFLGGVVLLFTMLGLLFGTTSWRVRRRALGIIGFVVLSLAILTQIFPDMHLAMQNRFDNASRSEGSIWNRVAYSIGISTDSTFEGSVLGYGIGAGAPAIAPLLNLPNLVYGESDWPRNINELGLIFGPILILMRLALAASLVRTSLRALRLGSPSALPFAGFAIVAIAVGSITNSPLNGFPAWLAVGLIFAIEREARQMHKDRIGAKPLVTDEKAALGSVKTTSIQNWQAGGLDKESFLTTGYFKP